MNRRGTVPGWSHTRSYSKTNKEYQAPGYANIILLKENLEPTKVYYVKFTLTLYYYNSSCEQEVVRIVGSDKDPIIIEQHFRDRYPDLDKWMNSKIKEESEDIYIMSREELGGGILRGETDCPGQPAVDINIIESGIREMIPENIIELLRYYAKQILYFLNKIVELEEDYNFRYDDIKDEYDLPDIDRKR